MRRQREHRGSGGDAVLGAVRNIIGRGQGDGGDGGSGRGWEGKVTGRKSKNPGLVKRQRIVQCSKTN